MEPAKLTKTAIDKVVYTGKQTATGWSHDIRWDTSLPGFGLRVHPTGKKVFVLRYRQAGTRRLLTLGTYGSITLYQARELAKKELAQVANQKDPVLLRKQAKVKAKKDSLLETTLGDAYKAFKQTRNLAATTLKGYDRVMADTLKDWQNKPLVKITSDMVNVRSTPSSHPPTGTSRCGC